MKSIFNTKNTRKEMEKIMGRKINTSKLFDLEKQGFQKKGDHLVKKDEKGNELRAQVNPYIEEGIWDVRIWLKKGGSQGVIFVGRLKDLKNVYTYSNHMGTNFK